MTESLLLQGHIVAEVCDLDNEPLVKMVGVEHVQTVVSHDIIGRLMIQCARQHGLASVWQNIMGFEGALRSRSSLLCRLYIKIISQAGCSRSQELQTLQDLHCEQFVYRCGMPPSQRPYHVIQSCRE